MTETTLAQALSVSGQTVTLADDADLESGQLLAFGSEYCRVLKVLTPTQAVVQRGVNGTQARAQESGITVTVGVPDDFLTGPQAVPVFGDDTDVLHANGPSTAPSYQLGGGGGGGDTVIVDGVDNSIKATVREYLASNPLAVVLTDTDGNAYTANNEVGSDVNISGVGGVTPLVGNGVTGTGSLRVTVASNNTPFHTIIDTGSTTAVTGNVTVVQPTAASLNATVIGAGAAGTANAGVVTVQGIASMTKLLVTPDSVALPANQSVNVSQINAVTPLMGNGTTGTGSQRVTIASDNTPFHIINDASSAVIGHVITDTGSTTAVTGNVTVVQSTGTSLHAVLDTTSTTAVTQATAANLNAAVVGTGTAGSAAGGVLTVQGVASMTKLLVTPDSVALPANQSVNLAQVNGTTTVNGGSAAGILAVGGTVATNVAITGNPINLGAQAVSSENAAVTTARNVQLVADLVGKLIVLPYANPENFVSGAITSAMTGTTTTSLIAAPASGLRNYITQITVSNASITVPTDILIQDGSGGTTLYVVPCPAGAGTGTGAAGATLTFPTPLRQPTTATAIFCANVTTGSSTKVSASGYKGA